MNFIFLVLKKYNFNIYQFSKYLYYKNINKNQLLKNFIN